MVFIVRDASQLSRPDSAQKVIKARDFWAFKEAQGALADALDRKDEILSGAHAAYEAERQRGYSDGSESARLEQSGNMIEIVSKTVEYFGKVESQMVELVIEAVRKVVSDFSDQQRVTTVVRNCLDLVRSQKHLSLHVHPSQVDFLRRQVDTLREEYPSIAHIAVHPDARLAADACMIESEIGIVEASLAGQVEILREALSRAFLQHVPQEEEVPLPGAGPLGSGQ